MKIINNLSNKIFLIGWVAFLFASLNSCNFSKNKNAPSARKFIKDTIYCNSSENKSWKAIRLGNYIMAEEDTLGKIISDTLVCGNHRDTLRVGKNDTLLLDCETGDLYVVELSQYKLASNKTLQLDSKQEAKKFETELDTNKYIKFVGGYKLEDLSDTISLKNNCVGLIGHKGLLLSANAKEILLRSGVAEDDDELISITYKQVKDLLTLIKNEKHFKQTGPDNLGATEGVYIKSPYFILTPDKNWAISSEIDSINCFIYPNTAIVFNNIPTGLYLYLFQFNH